MRPVTDPNILAALNSPEEQPPQGLKPVTDPALLAELNAGPKPLSPYPTGPEMIDRFTPAVRATANMIASAPGYIAGGLEALARAPFQGVDKAREEMEKTQKTLSFKPFKDEMTAGAEAKMGQGMEQAVLAGGDIGQAIAPEGYDNLGRFIGQTGMEAFMNFLPVGGVAGKGKKAKPKPDVDMSGFDNIDKNKGGPTPPPDGGLPPVDFSELPPLLPETPVERPLPNLNIAPDEVPLLPETRIAQEGAKGETPLPQISEELLRAKLQGLDPAATGDLLSIAPEVPMDRGHRPVGTDGTPLRGMAEDVPTTDFPLRQEVMDTDAFRQMTDFAATHVEEMRAVVDKKWEAVDRQAQFLSEYAGSKEARAVEDAALLRALDELHVAQEQLAAMEEGVRSVYRDFGVERAQDAWSRGIYDRLYQSSIQPKHTFDPVAAKIQEAAARIDETTAREAAAARNALRKKQGGAYNPGEIVDGLKKLIRELRDPEKAKYINWKDDDLKKGILVERKVLKFLETVKTALSDHPDVLKGDDGKPLILFRGQHAYHGEAAMTSPREGYAVFLSDSPHVASTFGSSHVVPVVLSSRARLIEGDFRRPSGLKDFFGYDNAARNAGPDTVIRQKNFSESGPAEGRSGSFGKANGAYVDNYIKNGFKSDQYALTDPSLVKPLFQALEEVGPKRLGGVGKKQGGAIDPQVFKEGMKRMLRSLSKLTDQPWVAAKFPGDKYMTNGDGTPLILLHGTRAAFDELKTTSQGVHAGFVVPAHLIAVSGDMAVQPMRAGRELRAIDRRIETTVARGDEKDAYLSRHHKGVGHNIRPVVVRKGNYPFLNWDAGNWSPTSIMDQFFTDMVWEHRKAAKENGRPEITDARAEWYRIKTTDQALSSAERNRYWKQFLGEAGIDGFFYRNEGESLNKWSSASTRHAELAKKQDSIVGNKDSLQHPISFVTWDAKNLESLYSNRTPVPTKERGGAKGTWDPGAIREALKEKIHNLGRLRAEELVTEVEKAAVKLKEMAEKDQTVWDKISGNEIDLIRPDAPLEVVKKAALEEPDISNWRAFSAGALSKAETARSTVVKELYHWWDNAIKRAERWDRDWVRPAADSLKRVWRVPEDVVKLQKVFERERANKAKYTDEELRAGGLNDAQVIAYNNLRNAFDKAIDVINEVRLAKGKNPITPEDAYMSARWRGPWRATFTQTVMRDGKPYEKVVWQVHETTKWGAQKAVDYIKHNFPDLKATEVAYKGGNSRVSKDMMAGYLEMLEFLDKTDPRVLEIKQLMEDTASMETVNLLGQEKHFKKKTGVRGFAGDRPWANQVSDAKLFFTEQLNYVRNAFEWAEKQKAAELTKQLLADEKIAKDRPGLVEFGTEYAKHQTGIGTKRVFDELESMVAETLGISPAHLDKTLGVGKSAFYLTKLGFGNVPFTISQLVQPVFTAPYHSNLVGQGYAHNAIKTWGDAGKNGGLYVLAHLNERSPGLEKSFFNKMDPVMREAALYADQNAVVDINPLTDIADLKIPESMAKAQKILGFNIRYSEMLARSTAFFGFVSHLEQSGKFPKTPEGRLKMFQMAEDATKFTMVDYRPSERAMFFQRTGLAGNALSTLQTFKINQLNQMTKYLGDAKRGNPLPALQFFGAYLMFGGVVGFVGLEDIDTLWRMVTDYVVPDDMYADLPDWAKKGPKLMLVENLPKWAAYGGVSAVTGLDLYRRFDSSNITPISNGFDQTLATLFPFVGDLWKQGKGVFHDIWSSDKATELSGWYNLTPAAGRGAFEEMVPGWESQNGTTPQSSDPTRGVYRRTPKEADVRKFGMRSLKEASTRDEDYQVDRLNKVHADRRDSVAKKVRNNIVMGAPANLEKNLVTYFKLGGDPESLMADPQLQEAIFNRNSTRFEKLSKAAEGGSYPKVMELLRYMKAHGYVQ